MLQTSFSPFPEIKTARLVLRKLTLEDTPEIYFLRSDEQVLKYIGRAPATSINDARDFILNIQANAEKGESILWAIAMNTKPGELIGTICYWRLQPEHYRAEIGYTLHPKFWRKGIMKEAIEAVLEYGFEVMKLHSIEARLNADNHASAALLEKTGFTRDAHFREDFFFNDKFFDTLVYSRLK
jgi:ribosomal-protein-alanine N-acetyltransferase